MQQVNLGFAATHYYQKVLETEPVQAAAAREDSQSDSETVIYDLRPLAAHNLALIYQESGNILLAKQLLETYCTV